jgi:beta-1,4-mannosyl-glycoprotein beta-1,4-N-acetylglucosaminyltransferase
MLYNELDMLEYRLRTLDPVVDIFVLVEARQTQAGNPKQLYYEKNRDRYAAYAHKIVHKAVDLPCKTQVAAYSANQWVNENQQRNEITTAVLSLQLNPDDLVMVSDLDEIPDPVTIAALKKDPSSVIEKGAVALEQDLYYYNIETLFSTTPWAMAKLSTANFFEKVGSAQHFRHISCPSIPRGGWHLSYFGSPSFIRNKIKQCGHQELNLDEYTDLDKILERMHAGTSVAHIGHKLIKVPRETNRYLPPDIGWLEHALALSP